MPLLRIRPSNLDGTLSYRDTFSNAAFEQANSTSSYANAAFAVANTAASEPNALAFAVALG